MATIRRTSVIDGKLVIEEIIDPNLVTVRKKRQNEWWGIYYYFSTSNGKIVLDANLGKTNIGFYCI